MKVIILTEGSRNIGFGHITRCAALYQAFKENSIRPLFLINGDETIRDLLKDMNYEIVNWIEKKKELFNCIKNADVVVIDSYIADYELYEKVSKLIKVPVYIDDNKRIDYPRGIVVNGTIYAEKMNYPRKEGVTYLLGSKYIPIRKEFWDVPKKAIKENIEDIMITFGGDDMRNLTPKVLKLLNKNYPELYKKIVIGRGFKNIEQIEFLKNERTELVYFPDAEKMKKVMLESDIAISAGGQTLYELAKVGVPTIAISVASNQIYNAKGWQKTGFIEYAGWWEDKAVLENIKNSIEKLKNQDVRLGKHNIGRKFVNGKGAGKIIGKIIERLKNLN